MEQEHYDSEAESTQALTVLSKFITSHQFNGAILSVWDLFRAKSSIEYFENLENCPEFSLYIVSHCKARDGKRICKCGAATLNGNECMQWVHLIVWNLHLLCANTMDIRFANNINEKLQWKLLVKKIIVLYSIDCDSTYKGKMLKKSRLEFPDQKKL